MRVGQRMARSAVAQEQKSGAAARPKGAVPVLAVRHKTASLGHKRSDLPARMGWRRSSKSIAYRVRERRVGVRFCEQITETETGLDGVTGLRLPAASRFC